MPPKDRDLSSTPVPSTEQQSDGSQLPDAEWNAMQKVLNAIYDYRDEEGFDRSKLFHRKVNKRVIPEYYDTIKEPMALSTIKQKIMRKEYQTFREFVRDFALIPHNAQVFNVPESGAFQDALVIKEQIEKQLQLLVKDNVISQEVATLPDLGEIPTYTPPAPVEETGEVEADEEEESDEADDDEDGEEDDEGRKKKRRGPRSGASIAKREAVGDDDDEDGGKSGKRGRPPKLLTPMEARMQTILKGIRKPKNSRGQLMIKNFDRLPDKATLPDYYNEIKIPMAYDQLKRKVKRKKYTTLEDFMADVNLMFNNAKQYNTDDSQIYREAVALQVEAGRLYDAEKAKPDETFADEEGKIPLPNGVLHNGELYKVGDWVHVQNINDLTKPIPAQIYRTYKDKDGSTKVNVCWYYRPEQTVHRHDKHFFPSEVVKTGRYRDHPIEQIEGKCFIMFYTRYFKGRPRNLPEGTEIYVCQSRYNESAHQFNTIKTWASCLPDEVRDRDYEMDLFDHPRKMKKFPSPIAYLLKDEQQETDDFPRVTWGADGAPPKIGAVHRRPRNEKDSPPPEPTPPPPPKMPTPPPRQIPTPQTYTPTATQQPRPLSQTLAQTYHNYTPRPQQYPQYSSTSAPSPAAAPATLPRQPSATPHYQQPSMPHQPQATASRPVPPATSTYPSSSTPAAAQTPAAYPPRAPMTNYRDPPPVEVYTLPDAANLSIPAEVREQYQRDEMGRVLFFTTPPVSTTHTSTVRGHSARYLAEKMRRQDLIAKKRKEREAEKEAAEQTSKRARAETARMTAAEVEKLKVKALNLLNTQLATAVASELSEQDLEALAEAQKAAAEKNQLLLEHEKQRKVMRGITLGSTFFADDQDSRSISA